jgi:hypothetical protein
MADKPILYTGSGSTSPTTQTPSAPAGGQINLGGTVTPGSAGHVVDIQPPQDAPLRLPIQLGNEGLSAANYAIEQQQEAKQ